MKRKKKKTKIEDEDENTEDEKHEDEKDEENGNEDYSDKEQVNEEDRRKTAMITTNEKGEEVKKSTDELIDLKMTMERNDDGGPTQEHREGKVG